MISLFKKIKNNFYVILLFFGGVVAPICLESCNEKQKPIHTSPTGFSYGSMNTPVETYVIDGHDYIGSLHGVHGDWATHSGSCNHPSHKIVHDTIYVNAPTDTVFCVITPEATRLLKHR